MTTRRTPISLGLGCAVALLLVTSPRAQAPQPPTSQTAVTFATDIRPILEEKCLGCHGDTLKLSRLDLRTRESAIGGGVHGAALVPGNAEQSRLYRMVAGLE